MGGFICHCASVSIVKFYLIARLDPCLAVETVHATCDFDDFTGALSCFSAWKFVFDSAAPDAVVLSTLSYCEIGFRGSHRQRLNYGSDGLAKNRRAKDA